MPGRGSAPPFISSCFAFLLLLAISCTPVLAVVNHAVAWSLNVNYDTSGQTFTAGDTITFTWSGNHDVMLVSESGYTGCTPSSSDPTYTSSPTVVNLTEAGKSYFIICSISDHCSRGMKYNATTLATSSNSSSSSPPTPPSSSTPSPPGNTASIVAFSPLVTFISVILLYLPFLISA